MIFKQIALLIALIYTANTLAAYEPNSIKGQADASESALVKLQVPNKLATLVAPKTLLNETGNTNILANPGFEHSTVTTGWTNSAGSAAAESTVVIDGKKSLKVTLSAQALALTQDSTLYAAQFADGVQGLAMVRVKTSVSGIKVCSRQAGATSSSLCVDVQANSKWGLYKVPFILGATSNGISIHSNAVAVTGDVYVDSAFVGAVDLKQDFQKCTTASCTDTFSAKISSAGVVSAENMDFINGDCSGGNPWACTFNTGTFSVAPNCVAQVQDGASSINIMEWVAVTTSGGSWRTGLTTSGAATGAAWRLICTKQGADWTSAQTAKVGSTYSSNNADTGWASCGHTPSSFTGFGSVTAIETMCKRDSENLLMRGRFTVGVSTGVEARVSLPLWNGTQLVSKGTTSISAIQVAGAFAQSLATGSTTFVTLMEPSTSYITFGYHTGAVANLTKRNGNDFTSTGTIISITASIPIEGWENSNIIIANLSGLESCSSTLACTDILTANVTGTTGAIVSQNVTGTLTVTRNAAGTYTINYANAGLTVAPTVDVNHAAACTQNFINVAQTTTSVQIITRNSSNLATDCDFSISIGKQAPDYAGKTARAVSSDANIRTPGVTKVVHYSAVVGTTGTVSNEIGDLFNGNCTNADPSVCTFTTPFASTPNCRGGVNSSAGSFCNAHGETTTTVNLTCTDNAGTTVTTTTAKDIECHGISP